MNIDWFTFVIQIINFAVLVYLLSRFLYGPITRAKTRLNRNYITQGVTTIVTGNCGGGRADVRQYLQQIDEAGAGTNVEAVGFLKERQAIVELFQQADIFASPAEQENGVANVYVEAMACGCPVIAGNRDGSVDALAHGELGRLIDPHAPDELLQALVATLGEGRRHDRPIPGLERFSMPRFSDRVDEFPLPLRVFLFPGELDQRLRIIDAHESVDDAFTNLLIGLGPVPGDELRTASRLLPDVRVSRRGQHALRERARALHRLLPGG